MEQLLTSFGIDARLIVIQIFNFVILAGLLTYFLYTPILNLLRTREEKIKQGLEDAERAAEAKASAERERKEVLEEAHKGADEVAARAVAHAKEEANAIVETAHQKAAGVLASARDESAHIKEQALAESEAEVAKLAVLAAEKILRGRA